MSRTEALLLALAAAAVAAAAPAARAGHDPWWNDAWEARRAISTYEPQKGRAPSDVALCEIVTNGHARPDGGDVRVLDAGGAELPRRVLSAGDDRLLVLFPAKPRSRYAVYFGNRGANEPGSAWEPRAALVVESHPLAGPPPTTWAEAQAALATPTASVRRGLAPTIACGFDPLGREREVILRFRGALDCPDAGEYEFATSSIDASFLAVDGRLVAEWGGRHDARGGEKGDHAGRVELGKGPHVLEYVYATSGEHGFGCNAGWRPPRAERLGTIPAQAWAGTIGAQVGELETRRGAAEAEFGWACASDLGLEGREAVLFAFVARAPHGGAAAWRWDFGDGTSSEEEKPRHVFLERGVYPVRLEVTRKDGEVVAAVDRVRAEPERARWPGTLEDRLAEYAKIARGYAPERLRPLSALALGRLFLDAGLPDAARGPLERALGAGALDLTRREHCEAVLALADIYRSKRELALAAAAAATVTACPDAPPASRDRAAITRAEALIEAGEPDAAEEALRPLAARKGKDDPPRLARILAARAELARGRRAEAAAALAEIEAKERRGPARDAALGAGNRAVAFHAYLRAGDFDAAEDEVRALVWEMPTALVGGEPDLLLGKLRAAQGRAADAVACFERALAAAPDAPRAADALVRLADVLERLGDPARARAALERCAREHPEAPEAEAARARLRAGR
jgi:TolA-binding protein